MAVWAKSIVFILAIALTQCLWSQANPATGLTATVDAQSGEYVVADQTSTWQFRGSVGSPVQKLAHVAGHDALGSFHSVRFDWSWNGIPVTGEIKTYDRRSVARFRLTYNKPTPHPQLNFPNFTALPTGLHVFSYREFRFAPPQFVAGDYGTPWLLYDDHSNAAIISPAGGFSVTALSGDGQSTAGVGLRATINEVPAGYSVSSVLVMAKGIGQVYDNWGDALNQILGRVRPSNEADDSLRFLGYYTDAGAFYYYNFDPKLGYAGTLKAEVSHLQSSGIPVHYLQLDSWWYQKDNLGQDGLPLKPRPRTGRIQRPRPVFPPARWNITGGTWLYEASHTLFPQGLNSFHKEIGLPFMAHGRYIGQDSPYHETYRIAGITPIDPAYWNHIASYMRNNGVVTYEQDWLGYLREYSGFDSSLRIGDEFFDSMAAAMKAQGLTMQYCSAEPSMFLQGARYSNLTTIRVSDDRFVRARWHDFLFTSQLAGALGIWPWADNATSQDVNAMLLQALSGGPVGFGDEMGQENRQNLMQTSRADGVIVKPDAPLIPVESDYIDGATGRHGPTLGYTHTSQGGTTNAYVFAFAVTPEDHGAVQFDAHDVGLDGAMVVYDYFAHHMTLVPAGGSFRGELEADDASFYICATPGKSGVAFLGDRDDFVGTGRMRIASIEDSTNQFGTTVLFANGEKEITLHGHAGFNVQVSTKGGRAETTHYDPDTGEFDVTISPDSEARPVSRSTWEPPVREVHVVIRRR